MGSHTRRVQRKIKRMVKRKVQSKPRPQTSTKTQKKMDEMMKMMLLMKGGQQQQNQNAAQDLLTAKEIIAKQNAEEARKQRETQQRIKQLEANEKKESAKAKTQALTEKEQQLLAMEEIQKQKREAESKLRNTKNEIERKKLQAIVDALNQKYDLERQTLDLMLQSQGIDDETVKKKHELEAKRGELKRNELKRQQKEKEYEIENLEKELQITNDNITETKAKLEKLLTLTGHENAQVYKKMLKDIDGYNDFLNSNVIDKLNEIVDTKSQKSLLRQVGVDAKLKNANKAKVALSRALRDLKGEYERLDDLNTELKRVNNENEEMKRDITSTQHAIKRQNYKSQINDAGELQYMVRTRIPFEEIDENGIMHTVYKPVEMWKNADWIDPNTDYILSESIAEKLGKAEVDNKQYKTIKKQVDARYNRNERDLFKRDAYNDAEQHEKLLAIQQASKNKKDKLNTEKWREEALNSENIKATNEQLEQEYIKKAQHEQEAEDRKMLHNAQIEARNKRVMAQVQEDLNTAPTSSDTVTEAETLYTAANTKYDEAIDDDMTDEDE